jgi:hypothetical protein
MDEIVRELTMQYGCILLRSPFTGSVDYDFFVAKMGGGADEFLHKQGFICTRKYPSYIEYIRFTFDGFQVVEIATSLLRSNLFTGVEIRSEYVQKYLENIEENDLWLRQLRYLLSLRRDIRSQNFFNTNIDHFIRSGFYLDRLTYSPFRAREPKISSLMKNKLGFLLSNVTWYFIFNIILKKLTNQVRNLFKKRIYCLVGVDGAGKTTIIEQLLSYGDFETVYMGGVRFRFSDLYTGLMQASRLFVIPVRLAMFLENILRYTNAKYYNLKGYHVLLDRYPVVEYSISPSKYLRLFYYVFYKFFFPRPHKVIMVRGDSCEIFGRKQEVTVSEINTQQMVMSKSKHVTDIVENLDGDFVNSINKVMRIIYEG